jgi:hypothetical protein
MAVFNEGPKDARGRVLQEGDEVILAIKAPIYFRVGQILPILDPKAPRGLMQLHLIATAAFTTKGGAVHPEFIRVQTAEEAGPSPFTMLDIQERQP